ncbi:LuxR family transcriptional regulator [Amaricoccus sp.]|uniref:helix-turn-helix transcriptional regulator n=1 Tax=Amaricoccus sp. TaxID=1872485 RepID=UPI001B7B56D1|nr:LuxR family transcriptional regulator [Amaricoccus sp.]MBP7002337.1 autoinducer binding domain-containing protein [Amaricoccus sp.]
MAESPALTGIVRTDPITFETEIERLERIEDVWAATVAFARSRGVRRIGYHHLPPPGATDAGCLRVENDGFGEALLAQYLAARQAGVAVLATNALNCVQPVYLDELERQPELTERERSHLARYRAAGVTHGVAFSVYGPNGRNGLFAAELPVRRLPAEDIGALRWAGQAMHLRYCDLIVPQLGRPPSLSDREAEVLAWVARGKSNASIGEILGISSHTVDAHLRRIYLKLGVVDRLSAALRGLGFGLIRLDA